jgi:hypothetical protein
MSISCDGYTINQRNAWSKKVNAEAGLKAKVHAEPQVWRGLQDKTICLLVQDAFPCRGCHEFFESESGKGHSIIIKVTGNKGDYSKDHGLPQNAAVPCIIYYHGGTSQYTSLGHVLAGGLRGRTRTVEDDEGIQRIVDPPTGFPAHPDISNF